MRQKASVKRTKDAGDLQNPYPSLPSPHPSGQPLDLQISTGKALPALDTDIRTGQKRAGSNCLKNQWQARGRTTAARRSQMFCPTLQLPQLQDCTSCTVIMSMLSALARNGVLALPAAGSTLSLDFMSYRS